MLQHLLCPVCSHPAPGSPCTAQHLPAPLLGTQAQMGQDPAPAQGETSAQSQPKRPPALLEDLPQDPQPEGGTVRPLGQERTGQGWTPMP